MIPDSAGPFGLEGRVALVTGASGGIGQALALGLSGAGAQLLLAGRSKSRLQDTLETVLTSGCDKADMILGFDLSSPRECRDLVHSALDTAGKVDILINVAGVNRRRPSLETTEEDWDTILSSNLKSVFFLSREVVKSWIESGRDYQTDGKGKILNVGSLAGTIGIPEIGPYGASKLGVVALTRSLGVEWAGHGICVNTIAPGYIETPLTVSQGLFEHPVLGPWIRGRIPMNRPGKPEDLVGAAVFFCGRASDYITGQTLFVDGGFEAG